MYNSLEGHAWGRHQSFPQGFTGPLLSAGTFQKESAPSSGTEELDDLSKSLILGQRDSPAQQFPYLSFQCGNRNLQDGRQSVMEVSPLLPLGGSLGD